MLAKEILPFLASHWPLVLSALIVFHLLRNKYHNGLNRYPGPAVAAYTDWWRFFDTLNRKAEQTHLELHSRYGDIVRLGPNVLSFANPLAIRTIYGLNKKMTKSDFYPVQQAVSKGERLQSLFSTKDEDYHAKYRRCVNNAFSMSSLVGYEPLVDITMDVFIDQTRKRYSDTGRYCNFSRWLQFFAFDTIGEITWGKRLGFVDRDEDVDGIVNFVAKFLDYAAVVGQIPLLDLIFEKNPIKLRLQKWGISKTVFPVTKFALEQSAGRSLEMEKIKRYGLVDESSKHSVDLLTRFHAAQHDHPEFMTDKQVLSSCTSMIFAGSETTAISLSSIFYHLSKHPQVYQKLMAELDQAAQEGRIKERDHGKVSWSESLKLPYLDAVIQESFRMHPAPGLILERVVPPQGIEILGEHIPGGTIVGCSAWVVHRREEVFGSDARAFRPERWLDAKPDQLREMKAAMFQFGAGARSCIGRNISLLEIYKLVPTFCRNFEFCTTNGDWETRNAWFVRQLNFYTRFKPRMIAQSV